MTPQQHLCPKPLEIAERFRFYKRNQQERETVLAYAADLKKLATHCNFARILKKLWEINLSVAFKMCRYKRVFFQKQN